MVRASVLTIGLAGVAAASALAETQPAPGLTGKQAMAAFAQAVLVDCLGSLRQGVPISGLSEKYRADLHPAAPEDRNSIPDPAVPAWTTMALGGHLLISEPSADRCNVVADQLPVDPTFQLVANVSAKLSPPFVPVPVKPGYNPIAYQFEQLSDGQRYIVHLEGAEPGGPDHPLQMQRGHAFRFSLLQAWVVRQPAAEKPLFR